MENNVPEGVFSYLVTLCNVKLLCRVLVINITEVEVIFVCKLECASVRDEFQWEVDANSPRQLWMVSGQLDLT